MKAVVWTEYGSADGLKLKEIERPDPKADEILVKIHATTVTAGDCEMRRLQLPLMLSFPMRLYTGLFRPKRITILGQELSGEVAEVGNNVTSYKVGDQVFGTTGFKFGAYAEYICLPAEPGDAQGVLAEKPESLTYEEAASIPTGALEALHYLQSADVKPGEKVLIIGGGGSIGTYSIQMAKHFGAAVTAVDSNEKLALMQSLGADRVIDYTKEDYTQGDESYDLIIDVVGKHSVSKRLKLLKEDGLYFLAFAKPLHILLSIWTAVTSKKRVRIESASQDKQDLVILKRLIESGKIRPIIDQVFPLNQIPEAHRYVDSGRKKGNVCVGV